MNCKTGDNTTDLMSKVLDYRHHGHTKSFAAQPQRATELRLKNRRAFESSLDIAKEVRPISKMRKSHGYMVPAFHKLQSDDESLESKNHPANSR